MMVFTVPVTGGKEENEELNRYLRGNRVVSVDKQFCQQSDTAFWSFCVTVADNTPPAPSSATFGGDRKNKVDYREVLDDKAFSLFSHMRAVRKAMSTEQGLPAYTIFTDAELAEMTKLDALDEMSIGKIVGIGPRRAEKFGSELLKRLRTEATETGQQQY